MRNNHLIILCFAAISALCNVVNAEGEAGILSLRGQGHFYVGMEVSKPDDKGAVTVKNQMYVGFQLPAENAILIHWFWFTVGAVKQATGSAHPMAEMAG